MYKSRTAFNLQPYRVALGFTCGLLSAIVAVLILISSNNRPVDRWLSARVRPTVLLAICTVVANVSVHFVLAEGLPILWWLEAKKPSVSGTHAYASYERLENIYNQGMSVRAALCGAITLHPTRAGLASIATVVVALNGPFLQRSSRIEQEMYTTGVQIRAQLAAEPPYGFSGIVTGRTGSTQALMPRFATVVKAFSAKEDIILGNNTGCMGTCTAEVEAMGLIANCTIGEYAYNMQELNPDPTSGIMINVQGGMGFFSEVVMETQTHGRWTNAIFQVRTQHKNKIDVVGKGISQNCTLTPSTVRYPIRLTNSTVVLTGDITNDRFIHHLSSTGVFGSTAGPSTFGGVYLTSMLRYNSGARITFAGAVGYAISTNGSLSFEFANIPEKELISPNVTWGDPMPAILAGMREIMFRSAIMEGTHNTSQPMQVVPGKATASRQIYRTDYYFLAISVATVVVGLLGTAPMFWGMWSLRGEEATLDPVKLLAKAKKGDVVIVGGDMGYPQLPEVESHKVQPEVQVQSSMQYRYDPFVPQPRQPVGGGWAPYSQPPLPQQHQYGYQGVPHQQNEYRGL